MRDTVGDLDIVVSASDRRAVVARFTSYPDVEETLARGVTRASVRLRGGLSVDLRVVPAESFGAALAYFTGSKAHNIGLRRIAQDRGLKLNEYDLFRGTKRISGDTELSVYAALGLAWIPPELREDRGEIDAAREGRLPNLVELTNLRGDLHVHTTATDGRDTLETMIAAAKARGFEYEVNAHPERLDLGDAHCRMARDEGVLVAINSDAHAAREFDNLRFGVGQARRGWITPADVLNARQLSPLLALLRPGSKRPVARTAVMA